MITLYHCTDARSFRPLWALEEIGLPYRLEMLPFPPRFLKREYLAINPLGTIPLLIDEETRMTIRANAAAVDNIGVFFGEDIFIAIGSILLIKGFLEQNGILVEPLDLSVWAIPTAFVALAVHGVRLLLLDRKLRRKP